VTRIIALASETDLPSSQQSMLGFLKSHPYEVFAVTEIRELGPSLGLSKSNASWCCWALEKKGLIAKKRLGRRVYYGSLEAIGLLDTELSKKRQQ